MENGSARHVILLIGSAASYGSFLSQSEVEREGRRHRELSASP